MVLRFADLRPGRRRLVDGSRRFHGCALVLRDDPTGQRAYLTALVAGPLAPPWNVEGTRAPVLACGSCDQSHAEQRADLPWPTSSPRSSGTGRTRHAGCGISRSAPRSRPTPAGSAKASPQATTPRPSRPSAGRPAPTTRRPPRGSSTPITPPTTRRASPAPCTAPASSGTGDTDIEGGHLAALLAVRRCWRWSAGSRGRDPGHHQLCQQSGRQVAVADLRVGHGDQVQRPAQVVGAEPARLPAGPV